MKTEFKDVAHLYLGCEMQTRYRLETSQGIPLIKAKGQLREVDLHMLPKLGILLHDEQDKCNYVNLDNAIPILRPLSDMIEEEAIEVAQICFPHSKTKRVFRNYGHLKQVSIMGGKSFEMSLFINTAVFQIYSGSIGKNAVDNYQIAFTYLLSKHFDLFGLIKSGQAIDKTELLK